MEKKWLITLGTLTLAAATTATVGRIHPDQQSIRCRGTGVGGSTRASIRRNRAAISTLDLTALAPLLAIPTAASVSCVTMGLLLKYL